MTPDISPVDWLSHEPSSVDGFIYPFPDVLFVRDHYADGSPTPLLVRPVIDERVTDYFMVGGRTVQLWHNGARLADSPTIWGALNAVIRLAGASGTLLQVGVQQFVQRYGQLIPDPRYLREVLGGGPSGYDLRVPEMIRRYNNALGQHTPGPLGLPLWCYTHEARQLAITLDHYANIIRPGGFVNAGAWGVFNNRINGYLRLLRLKLSVAGEHAWQPPRQRIWSNSLLGLIYAQMLQVITEARVIRQCPRCGARFAPTHGNQRFCCRACNDADRNRRHRARKRANRLQTGTAPNGPA